MSQFQSSSQHYLLTSVTKINTFKNSYQAPIIPAFLSTIEFSVEENLNLSQLDEESMKEEKSKTV